MSVRVSLADSESNAPDVAGSNPGLRKQRPQKTALEARDEVVVNPPKELPERDAAGIQPRGEYDPRGEPERDCNPKENSSEKQDPRPCYWPDSLMGRTLRLDPGLTVSATPTRPVFPDRRASLAVVHRPIAVGDIHGWERPRIGRV
jgi:hypothetical protein